MLLCLPTPPPPPSPPHRHIWPIASMLVVFLLSFHRRHVDLGVYEVLVKRMVISILDSFPNRCVGGVETGLGATEGRRLLMRL